MKEIIEQVLHTSRVPQKTTVSKTDLFDQTKIAQEFNKFVANIRMELAAKLQLQLLKLHLKPTYKL